MALAQRRLGRASPDRAVRRLRGVGAEQIPLAEIIGDDVIEETVEWRHRPTYPIDPETGQGFAHVQYAFAAHRAVVDVDTDLGLVKVVELACTQDVGQGHEPAGRRGADPRRHRTGPRPGDHGGDPGDATGGSRNPSFTDYLIPTILDMPPMRVEVLEYPDPNAPYGLRGVGEPPTISSGPAIAAAIRAATGLDLCQIPIRPEHITGT